MHDRLESLVAERLQAGSENLYAEALTWMERRLIVEVLRLTHGNQSRAAEILGITRGCLRRKIRMQGIYIGQVISVTEGPVEPQPAAEGLTVPGL